MGESLVLGCFVLLAGFAAGGVAGAAIAEVIGPNGNIAGAIFGTVVLSVPLLVFLPWFLHTALNSGHQALVTIVLVILAVIFAGTIWLGNSDLGEVCIMNCP